MSHQSVTVAPSQAGESALSRSATLAGESAPQSRSPTQEDYCPYELYHNMTPSDALKGHESQGAVKTGHYAIEASVEMLESAPFDLAYNEDDAILSPRQQHRLDILDNVTASRSPRAVREVALGLGELNDGVLAFNSAGGYGTK